MKKNLLFVLLAVLVLICAVSCSSSVKKTGIQIDTYVVKDKTFSTAKLTWEDFTAPGKRGAAPEEGVEVSVSEVKAGSVFVALEPGTYDGVILLLGGEEYDVFPGQRIMAAIEVEAGKITPCHVPDPQ